MRLTPLEQRRFDAINARKAAHRQRAERLARELNTLAKPTIDLYDGTPEQPGKEIEIINPDTEGLLTYAFMKQERDLDLRIVEWGSRPPAGFPLTDSLWMETATDTAGPWMPFQKHAISNEQTFPIIQPLAFDWLRNNTNRQLYLRYMVEGWTGSQTPSEAIPLYADTIAPWRGGIPEAMTGEPSEPITEAWLTQHDDKLVLNIPEHPDAQPYDQLVVCWALELPSEAGPGDHVIYLQPVTAGYSVVISGDVIRQVGSGAAKAFYMVIDRAGNVSRISVVKTMVVALGQLPENLKPPRVSAYEDGCIDRADAASSDLVAVLIDQYDHHAQGDTIRATWAGRPLAPFTVGSGYSFPLSLPVPWQTLKAGYDFADPTAAQPATIRYEVEQRLVTVEQGAGIQVSVDLSLPGPVNPNEPDPVNPNLPAPEVLAKDETTRNVLREEHFEQDATLYLSLYESPQVGQTVTFFWNGQAGPGYDIQAGDQQGQEIKVTLPWALIRAGGNNAALPLHYVLSQTDGRNTQCSRATDVVVEAVKVILPEAQFLRLQPGSGLMTCTALVKHPDKDSYGVQVRIAPSEHLQAGRTIRLRWNALTGRTGGAPIDSATKEATLTVSASDAVNGLTWMIEPYADHILPTYGGNDNMIGRARLKYWLQIEGAEVGAPEAETEVAMVQPGGTCSIPPPTTAARTR